ncbi:MAG TPA: site-2 protease family protein [Gemmatimonadaceae bacterium]|nr:site-2 protease family protein [Gemmatimonadaceae bacterium]
MESVVAPYFAYWRRVTLGDREIVEGLVLPEHAGPSPALARILAGWDGHYYWESAGGGRWLVLVHENAPPRERVWLHAALFLITLLSTTIAGAAFSSAGDDSSIVPSAATLLAGLKFSLPLGAILLAHELGHYVVARRYRVNASLPYFIPFPSQASLLGTLGAFIRLRSPLFDRRTLFDVGIAGPLAGMVVAIPVLLLGLATSVSTAGPTLPLAHQYLVADGARYYLGDSLLMWTARAVMGHGGVILLSPLAIAGWVGVLVTSLNLLPLGQFDGGHISYALFGRRQEWVARAFWLALLPLGRLWFGWWVWAGLALLLGRGRLGHPTIIAPERQLSPERRRLGLLAIVLFLVTFMPNPLAFRDIPGQNTPDETALTPRASVAPTPALALAARVAGRAPLRGRCPALDLDPGAERQPARPEGAPCGQVHGEERDVHLVHVSPLLDVGEHHRALDDLVE